MNRVALVLALALAAAVSFAAVARADSSEGGAFMLPGYGARAWGMSGAVAARIDDESAVDWNPAGMSRASRSIGLAYVELVPESYVTQAQAAFVMPFGSHRDAETGVSRHAAGVMLTDVSVDLGNGETYRENTLHLAYAWSPQPLASFGIGLKGLMSRSGVANFDALGSSVDFSGRLAVTRKWSVAFVAHDAFSRYSYDDDRDARIEQQYVVGLARQGLRGVDLEADVVYVHEGWHRALIGAETTYLFGYVALRGGLAVLSAGEKRTTYSFGASARAADRLFVHYGASVDEDEALGTMHRFSLAVSL